MDSGGAAEDKAAPGKAVRGAAAPEGAAHGGAAPRKAARGAAAPGEAVQDAAAPRGPTRGGVDSGGAAGSRVCTMSEFCPLQIFHSPNFQFVKVS